MSYYKVNTQIANRIHNEYTQIENYFGEAEDTLSYIMSSLLMSNAAYGQVRNQIKTLISDMEKEKTVMYTLGITLQEIMNQYEKTEKKIAENYTSKSVLNPSPNNLDNKNGVTSEDSSTS
ncbi:hypothetical protein, partial [Anaerosporobacter sp.]